MPAAIHRLLQRRHLWINPARLGVADAPFFGRYNYAAAQPGLPPHRHPGAMEICYLVKGRQTYHVAGREYRLAGGDVFVTFPGEWHDTAGLPQEKGALYWLALRVEPARGPFLGRSGAGAAALRAALRALPARHFRGSTRMKEQLDALALACHATPEPLRAVHLAHWAEAFALEVVACAARPPAPRSGSVLDPVLRRVHERIDEPASVPELAALAGLSVSRFKARFKQETGLPPAEYALRVRVVEAARRLGRGDTDVTTVAHDLGFSSSQYFATVFKRFTGRTPGQKAEGRRQKAEGRRQKDEGGSLKGDRR